MRYIIVKYAKENWPDKAPIEASVFKTHSANECKIISQSYKSVEEGQADLEKLCGYHPSACYGIVEVDE